MVVATLCKGIIPDGTGFGEELPQMALCVRSSASKSRLS